MKPILFSEDATSFITNGYGRMSDAISCKVVEERNGEYELTMTYPVNGRHFSELSERMLLYSIHDDKKDKQPFRIYEISKPLNGIVTIHARHISYDLNKIVLSPFTAGSCNAAFAGITNYSATNNPFTFASFKNIEADFKIEVPTTCRSILGGTQGSILDVYGPGEFQWDGWDVKFYSQRGQDRPVEIRYGKNLTELEDTINIANTFNAVYPYWKGQEESTDEQGNKIYVPKMVYISDDPSKRVLRADLQDEQGHTITLPLEVVPLDLSAEFETVPSQTDLRNKAALYLTANKPWLESRNISVSFIALWQTEEYKNLALERVSLCDTVKVIHNKLGISVRKKIVKVDYDVLNERYNSMELGDSSKSFTSALSGDLAALRGDISSGMGDITTKISLVEGLITPKAEIDNAIDSAVQHAAEMIRGGLGGYVIMNTNANGQPEEIVISDNLDLDQAQNVWRWNKNGLAFSNDGYDFDDEHPDTLTLALTKDGAIVADRITSGRLTANIITAGVLTAGNGNTTLDMSTGRLVAKNLLIDTSLLDGSLEIRSDNFTVTPEGDVTLNDATLTNANASGSFTTSRKEGSTTYSTNSSAGSIAFYENSNLVTELSILSSAYPLNTHSNALDAFTIHLSENLPMTIGTPPLYNEDEYEWYYRFAINDTSKRMGFNEWVYAESLFVNSHLRGPNNYLLVGTEHDHCNLGVWGDLVVSGSTPKSRAVKTENYGIVRLDAMESAASLFSDIGSGAIGDDGLCLISFDPKFRETVDLSHEYQVFLTHSVKTVGNLSCEKYAEYFVVYGDPGITFDWVVYAKQKEFSYRRLEEWIPPDSKDTSLPKTQLEILADQYISDYEREVLST